MIKVPITIKLAKYSQYIGPKFAKTDCITFTHHSSVMIWNNVINEVGNEDQDQHPWKGGIPYCIYEEKNGKKN